MSFNPNLGYSQSYLNSNEASENDYNLYCFSQGYKNHEKGYWRGVLRNKNIDFDLRFNKEWNRRIELEGESLEKSDSLLQSSTQFSNEFIKFVNDNEIGWDLGRFENFKKKQAQTGGKKQKNKEWLLSNGIKRHAGALEIRTQNYKQFEENEKNKELKKAYLNTQIKQQEVKTGYQVGKQYEYSDKKGTSEKIQKSLKSSSDIYNTFKTITVSTNVNEQKGTYSIANKNKRIESNFLGDKSFKESPKRNLETEYNTSQYQRQILDKNVSSIGKGGKDKRHDIYKNQGIQGKYQTQSDKKSYSKTLIDQGYKKSSPKPFDLKTKYGTGYTSGKKNLQEFKYGQKGTYSDQKSNIYVKKSSDPDRPINLGRLEVSVEKMKKEKEERKPGSRTHERLCSSKKRKLSLDKDGKPLKNTSRLNVSTEKKKEKRERLNNIGRLEISAEKKSKERIERKPGSRKHDRIHSSKKKRKISYDKEGKPLTNTARLNVSTEKKKPKKERLDNLSKLDISVEGKKKERIERKPGSRKHDRIHSSKKKRKISYDKDGKPLTNIARLNVSTEKKKEKRERLDNHSQLEVSVEGKRKERIERKPGSRKHDRVLSSKKKRKISYDSEGKPLTNTSRLKVVFESNKLKYMEKDEYGHNKNMDRFDSFEKRKSDYAFKKYPTATKQFGQKQGVQEISSYSYYAQNQTPKDKSSLKDQPYQYNTYQKPQNQKFSSTQNKRQITTTGKIQTKDTTRQSYNYPVSTKKDIGSYQKSKQEGIKLDYQQYSTVSSSQFNTAETNAGSKYGRTKRIESSDKFLYKNLKQYGGQISNLPQDKKRYIPAGQRALSVPKKYTPPKRRGQTGYQLTPSQPKDNEKYKGTLQGQTNISKTIQKGIIPVETVKIDLSKYLPKQSSTDQKSKQTDKTNQPEIYEYYPLSKTSQKNKLVQLNKQKQITMIPKTSAQYQSKTAKKEPYKSSKISEDNIYEYYPSKSNIYEYKPAISQIKKGSGQRRDLTQSTEAGYKKSSINRQAYQNIVDKTRPISVNLDKYISGRNKSDKFNDKQNISVKSPSYSYQKDKIITYGNKAKDSQSLNNRYLFSPFSEENKRDSTKRAQRTKSEGKGSMAFFKLQFLTTKQVCEKFWNQIDTGELSSSMFNIPLRNSGAASKLSNFLSPEKNRQNKFSMSNEITKNTANYFKNGGITNKFGNTGMSNSTSASYMKNIKDVRHSYKLGFN